MSLEAALAEIPLLDIHTHLVGGRLGARGLHDILLYHMVVSDLYAAGCATGARLTQYPGWPTEEEAEFRIQQALPFLSAIQNTSSFWGVRIILADLHAAVEHYLESIPYSQVLSTATHISTDIDFRTVTEAEMEAALVSRPQAGPAERDIYASYVNEAFLAGLENSNQQIVFQFS